MLGATTTERKARRRNQGPLYETAKPPREAAIEWPTVGLALVIYSGFGLVTWFYDALPWWLAAAIGTYLIAWHGSLQHEVVHGHPTSWRRLNEALVFPSLWLWIPYGLYRRAHLRHHRNANLTDPLEDPESYYLTPERWSALGRAARLFYSIHNSFLGRLTIGPAFCLWRLVSGELRRVVQGDFQNIGAWALHTMACALVLYWVVGICQIPLLTYLALFVYPAISLSLVRSFAEHRAHPGVEERTVIVESRGLMALLFLNNNLHALHHAEPGLAWYRLPARFQARRGELLTANGGYRFSGYGEIFLRYFLWPKEHVRHPLGRAIGDRSGFATEVTLEQPARNDAVALEPVKVA